MGRQHRQRRHAASPWSPQASPNNRIATSRISVKVLQPYKGAYKAGQTVTLFQTGASMDDPAPPKEGKGNTATSKAQHIQLEGDPAYKAGEQYVLMLEAGPAGTQRPVSPEGRYRVDKKTGVLTGVVKNPVTNEIAGKSLKSLEKTLQSRCDSHGEVRSISWWTGPYRLPLLVSTISEEEPEHDKRRLGRSAPADGLHGHYRGRGTGSDDGLQDHGSDRRLRPRVSQLGRTRQRLRAKLSVSKPARNTELNGA